MTGRKRGKMKIEDIYPLNELEKLRKSCGIHFSEIKEAWQHEQLSEFLTELLTNISTNCYANEVTQSNILSTVKRFESLLNWNKLKQIYTFNEELWELIQNSEAFTFYSAAFDNLPFDCFCINHQFSQFNCVIVRKTEISLSFTYLSDNTISYIDIPFSELYEGKRIDEIIKESYEGTVPDYFLNNIRYTLSAIMYLCSEEPDIYTVKEPIPQRSPNSKKNRKQQTFNNNKVGMRLGHIIRENKKRYESAATSTGTGQKKAPHLRKAHYHHYWTGKKGEEKKIIVKFLSPIFVNSEDGEIITTIRKKEK